MEVVDAFGATCRLGDNVVHLEHAEGKLGLTAVPAAFLLADYDVPALTVWDGYVDVGAVLYATVVE